MTWRLTNHLDLTGGVRHDHNRQAWSVLVGGETFGPQRDSDGVTTWTAAARYRIAPDVMVYGRVATGSQPATMNGFSFPTSNAEMLTSYEAGLKSEFLDHKALFDVSVFYIDWADVQVGSQGDIIILVVAEFRFSGSQVATLSGPPPRTPLGNRAHLWSSAGVLPATSYIRCWLCRIAAGLLQCEVSVTPTAAAIASMCGTCTMWCSVMNASHCLMRSAPNHGC